MGLAGLLGGLPSFFGTMGYPAPNPYGNDPRRGGGRGMGDLRRKYKPYGDGDRNNPYQLGFPSFPPRDFGLAGNPYGGGPKTMAPAVMPSFNEPAFPTLAPGQYEAMLANQNLLDSQNPFANMTDAQRMAEIQQRFGAIQTYGGSPAAPSSLGQNIYDTPSEYGQPQMGLGQAYNDYIAQQGYGPSMMGNATPTQQYAPYNPRAAGGDDVLMGLPPKTGMGGANPYTINQPATLMPQPMQQPMQPQMDGRGGRGMGGQQQMQQQQQMQGNQMMNRPFAVRGR